MDRKIVSVGPNEFEFKEGNCATDWQNWLRSFELFAKASGIKKKSKRKNWLLHYAGPTVQKIYFNLPDKENKGSKGPKPEGYEPFRKDDYRDAVTKLQKIFAPKQNNSYERHIFRKMYQERGERIDAFTMRLRIQAERCNFGDQEDDNIKDQITSGCNSETLRRKILERGDKSLDTIIKLARISENVLEQQKVFGNDTKQTSRDAMEVCAIEDRRPFKRQWNDYQSNRSWNSTMECSRCGHKGHKSSEENCPAKGKECGKCGRKYHFARKCFTKDGQRMDRKAT